ncbi:MAG: hypothetical protein V8R46_08785 [Eubacterium ramulus]
MACCLPVKKETVSGHMYDWHIDGLMGGHSGMEIDKERANANKAFGRFLALFYGKNRFVYRFCKWWRKENAIAKQCDAVLVVPEENIAAFEDAVSAFETILKRNITLQIQICTFM